MPRAGRCLCILYTYLNIGLIKNIQTEGKHVVVLGKLNCREACWHAILTKGVPGNATVTFCHSRTPDLKDYTLRADILVAAIGKPQFVKANMVKEHRN